MLENKRIAIVHDWLVSYGGAERFLADLLDLFPDADVFSVVDFLKEEDRWIVHNKKVTTTFIQNLPKAKEKYRNYLPLMPLAIEQLDLSDYDLIISSSHCVAKGVITGPNQVHISYVHSPVRYAWDLQHQYLKEAGLTKGLKSWIARIILHYIRLWDYRTSNGVDYFLANSQFIAKRIWKCYRRKADVLYSGIDLSTYTMGKRKEDFYLTASRMVPYKKIDLIVEAFSKMPDKKLVVIGNGPDYEKIKSKASSNIELLGYVELNQLTEYMQKAKAFVFAAEEDFGRVPVEAQACGTPVIAFGKGGVLETVNGLDNEKPTGVFFKEQTAESICNAVTEFENKYSLFIADNCRENAYCFSKETFSKNMLEYVEKAIEESEGCR